jgi:hypothetical protein
MNEPVLSEPVLNEPVVDVAGAADRRRTRQAVRAHCPVDDWDFDPRYTDGVCPLCGWRPPGTPVEPPAFVRIDWFWPVVVLVVVMSVVMGILVLIAYNRA